MELSVALEEASAQVTLLHVIQEMPEYERASEEAPFAELMGYIHPGTQGQPGRLTRRTLNVGNNPAETISVAAADYDLLIMGAGGAAAADVGTFTEEVARNMRSALIAVKTRIPVGPAIRAARKRARPHVFDPETLSLLVDKWFAENTFHADEFSDLSRLIDIKRKRNVTISLGLPALNEEETIGNVIQVLKTALMQDVPLLDEIVLIELGFERSHA